MRLFFKILGFLLLLFGLIIFWYWADNQDYFRSYYNNLTEQQNSVFKWQDGDDGDKLMNRYRQHFTDKEFIFPRQKVTQVKLFKNIPILGVFTAKTLKQTKIDDFLLFCNDTTNFTWGETTWGVSESEYYFRLYRADNKVIGKIYICLDDCHMTSSKPFCPSMKFGGLSETGTGYINKLIKGKDNWEN
jgi:hypothetical protein